MSATMTSLGLLCIVVRVCFLPFEVCVALCGTVKAILREEASADSFKQSSSLIEIRW